jgi:hypothetical protein
VIDRRVADQQRRRRGGAGVADHRVQRRRFRLAAEGVVTTRHVIEQVPQAERLEDAQARCQRLVGQHRHTGVFAREAHRLHDTVVGPREIEQAAVVDLEEALARAGHGAQAGGLQRPCDQHAGALAHHPPDRVLGQRRAAQLDDQVVGRIRQVASRIDERAVEIEGD